MSVHLTFVKASVVNGWTIWKDEEGRNWKFPHGAGERCWRFASTEPIHLRARYGLPSNFYHSRRGEMDISPEMLRYVAEEVTE